VTGRPRLRWPLGVVDLAYVRRGGEAERARAAAADGFEHLDVLLGTDPATLALPIGCPTAFPRPVGTWCAAPAPPAGDGAWERAVRWWRAAPGALVEPWVGSVLGSTEAVREFVRAVPGVRLLVDTGHVAAWGGDPCELLHLAGHVQLRQGCPGRTQLHVDDPDGTVDFGAVLARLDALDYSGRLSVEHFDLPSFGWPLDDPESWARDLAARLRASG
jgi:sugar phosphate isomerase/epimerase